MSARDRQAGFSFQLPVRTARQRHSQIEVVRPATELRACPHRNHDAEDQRTALPADFGRGLEMAAGARRSERQRFYLSADARGDGERHTATLGKNRRNNQTHLVSRRPSYSCHDDADFRRRFIYRQQVARPQEYRYDADLRQNRRQEERGSHRVDSESDRLKQRPNVRTMIRTFYIRDYLLL